MPKPTPKASDDATMPFLEHLAELRQRLLRAAIAIASTTLACFFVAEYIYLWLAQPLLSALPDDKQRLVFLDPVEPFLVYVKVAAIAGVLAASPYVLYQLWKFVAPGLYAREKRAVVPFVLLGSIFFFGGAAFCRYVVLPYGLETLMGVGFDTQTMAIEPQITMEAYLSVSTKMLLAFGIVFELPVLVLFLSWAHLITYQTLLKRWRGALVLCVLIGAILTPPDVITQLMLFVPLYTLYLLSIGIAWVFGARPKKQSAADPD